MQMQDWEKSLGPGKNKKCQQAVLIQIPLQGNICMPFDKLYLAR